MMLTVLCRRGQEIYRENIQAFLRSFLEIITYGPQQIELEEKCDTFVMPDTQVDSDALPIAHGKECAALSATNDLYKRAPELLR
jgi:hypothetical protein